jgi:peptidoglycan-N-acetylglucosamine deacetylase
MRCIGAALAACVAAGAVGAAGSALASECPGNPNAIGTARTIAIDAAEHARIGTIQYKDTLPLADKEVVLTFDDGPLPPYSERVLDILAAECVRATFFIVGRQARAHPEIVRRLHDAGHTVATHSQNHPGAFSNLAMSRIMAEIDEGIASTRAALGATRTLAPFFRFPGLRRSAVSEAYLASQGLAAWSADVPSDDWRRIPAHEVIARTLDILARKGKGVVLMHDIQPVTTLALPALLGELKARGYRIVHVKAAGTKQPPSGIPQEWALRQSVPTWPRVNGPTTANAEETQPAEAASAPALPTETACGEPTDDDGNLAWCGREDSNLHGSPH